MASLLNNASLLFNPAGSVISYEEGKIFSVLPTNGDGDFTFIGGNGGTRVNQQGYIERTPANLLVNSSTFGTYPSGWSLYCGNSSVVTNNTNDTPAPNGTFTAVKVARDSATSCGAGGTWGFLYNTGTTTRVGEVFTASVWVKAAPSQTTEIRMGFWDGQQGIFQVGDEWERIEYTTTITNAQRGFQVFSTTANVTYYVWGPMTNLGSTALPYQPTTNRLNYPRITYQNGRGALLSEPQRTNLLTYSEQLDNAAWSSNGLIITANQGISPDGTQNADLLDDGTASSTQHWIYKGISFSYSTTYTISFYAKYISRKYIAVNIYNGSTSQYVVYDIQNGSVYGSTGDVTASITSVGNGWYRIVYTRTIAASGSPNFRIALADDTGSETYTGNNKQVYVWGCQIEAGSYPTSYIPTTSATITRPQDTTENSSASSVIGQTEGVLYTDFTFDPLKGATDFLVLTVSNGTTANNIILNIYNNTVVFGVDNSSSRVVQLQSSTITPGRHKMAGGYKNNDFALYLDGKLIGTDAAGSVPACSVVDVGLWANGAYPFAGNLNTVGLFNTRLTNTQLAELTTVNSGSGGNISYYGPYTIHTFTGSATFTPSFNGEVEVLVVAGGGGTTEFSGGGGAGGVLYASSIGVAQGTGYTITIGAGGGGLNGTVTPNNGSNSSAFGLTTIGGGGGASSNFSTIGRNGGSGGGIGPRTGTGGLGIAGQGNNGGNGVTNPGNDGGSGGGGGAGEAGQNGAFRKGGDGGDGLPFSISGYSTYYGGGGAGFGDARNGTSTPGIPGLGGGGYPANGETGNNNNTPGVNNTGGGAGANGPGGPGGSNGGSGIIIIRYLT